MIAGVRHQDQVQSGAKSLLEAFRWVATRQGDQYWADVQDRLAAYGGSGTGWFRNMIVRARNRNGDPARLRIKSAELNDVINAVMFGLSWELTAEGSDYWARVYHNLNEILLEGQE